MTSRTQETSDEKMYPYDLLGDQLHPYSKSR